jgi:parallel beta-helix repeat protein
LRIPVLWIVTCIVAGMLAAPAGAAAATRYVDFDTGNDQGGANSCLAIGAPCKSIFQALVESGTDPDRIEVDDDTYVEGPLTVNAGKTLTGVNFVPADSGATIVDPGTSASDAVINASGGATVSNLTVRDNLHRLVEVTGPATITGNVFDEEAVVTTFPQLLIESGAQSPTITGNTFEKLTFGGTAIRSLSTGSPTISGNTISHYNGGIDLRAGTPQVTGNEITGQTTSGSCDPCAGIFVSNAQATLSANSIHDPTQPGGAIGVFENSVGLQAGATLSRNLVSGGATGLTLTQTSGLMGPVTLSGDAILDYDVSAITTNSSTPATTLTATNVTLASTRPGITADIALNEVDLVLNSSIVFNTGISPAGAAGCQIGFSRGPAIAPGGVGCGNFQTTANPTLAGATDPHLLPGSPMIDSGDPAAPPGGTLDLDGEQRVLDGTADCATNPRRDIGADEFAGGALCPSVIPVTPPASRKKKCKKKKRKRPAAEVAKKKRCKKKKRRRQ